MTRLAACGGSTKTPPQSTYNKRTPISTRPKPSVCRRICNTPPKAVSSAALYDSNKYTSSVQTEPDASPAQKQAVELPALARALNAYNGPSSFKDSLEDLDEITEMLISAQGSVGGMSESAEVRLYNPLYAAGMHAAGQQQCVQHMQLAMDPWGLRMQQGQPLHEPLEVLHAAVTSPSVTDAIVHVAYQANSLHC